MSNADIPQDAADIAAEAENWIKGNWRGKDDRSWRSAVTDAGYSVPTWKPEHFGRGYSRSQAAAVAEAFAQANIGSGAEAAVQELQPFVSHSWIFLAGGPLKRFGTPEQLESILKPILTGEAENGCLLYSEPGAGSDLASLQTRAERVGDEYIINGQKIWTTNATTADFGILLARTDWDADKHAGISLFIFPMQQDGVEVRPIRQMTGDAEFNEVFITNARVPSSNLIGGEGNGWKALQLALQAERQGMGEMAMAGTDSAAPSTGRRSPLFARSDDLLDAAREAERINDPIVRDEIMKIHSWRLTNEWNNARAMGELKATGNSSLASLGKLANSRILHGAADLKFRLLGDRGLQYDQQNDPEAYEKDYDLLMSFINSIGGGTDQIQRNIISERVLGLPRGPQPDKGVPFRDVKKAESTRSLG